MELFGDNRKGAEFSECGNYRYKLWRIWDNTKPLAMCIGLNPSTANSEKDDATIHILNNSLYKLGYGGFYMMNLFSFISPTPKDLLTCHDPIADTYGKLVEVGQLCNDIIFCWGTFPMATERAKLVLPDFKNPLCFGINKNGTPFHPRAMVYIKGALENPKLSPYKLI